MKRAVPVLLMAVFAAAASPAFAQQMTTTTTTATTATVSQHSQPTYGQLITALNATRSETAQLNALSNLTTNNVHIVKVQSIMSGQDQAALSAAVSRNQAQLNVLRRSLGSVKLTATTDNSTITLAQFLTDNKIGPSRVVAVDVNSAGVNVFVQ